MSSVHKAHWEHYWKHPLMTSLHAQGNGFYDAEIHEFWHAHLDRSADRIIDLACGNGGLSFLADDILNRQANNTQITGIDYASSNPFKRLGRKKSSYPRLAFLPNTPIEKLPFASGTIDMAVSQWGFEYADRDKALKEINRVLKADAGIAFICHRTDSAILKTNLKSLGGMQVLYGDGVIFDLFLALDKLYSSKSSFAAVKADAQRARLLGEINGLLFGVNAELALNTAFSAREFIGQISALFSSSQKLRDPQRQIKIKTMRDNLLNEIGRFEHLEKVALDEDALCELIAQLQFYGFHLLENHRLHYRDIGDIGTALVAVRRSG